MRRAVVYLRVSTIRSVYGQAPAQITRHLSVKSPGGGASGRRLGQPDGRRYRLSRLTA
jgi:hypothetical protein